MVAPGGAGGSAQVTVAPTRGGERFVRRARQVAAIRTPGWLILITGTVVLGEGHRLSGRRGPDVHGPCTIRPAGQVGGCLCIAGSPSRTLTGRSSFGLVLGAEYGPNVPTGCDERPGRPGLLAYPPGGLARRLLTRRGGPPLGTRSPFWDGAPVRLLRRRGGGSAACRAGRLVGRRRSTVEPANVAQVREVEESHTTSGCADLWWRSYLCRFGCCVRRAGRSTRCPGCCAATAASFSSA